MAEHRTAFELAFCSGECRFSLVLRANQRKRWQEKLEQRLLEEQRRRREYEKAWQLQRTEVNNDQKEHNESVAEADGVDVLTERQRSRERDEDEVERGQHQHGLYR